MRTLGLTLLLALACSTRTTARASDDECAIEPAVVPDFALVDLNPSSPSFGSTLRRDDFLGRVVVIYWAIST